MLCHRIKNVLYEIDQKAQSTQFTDLTDIQRRKTPKVKQQTVKKQVWLKTRNIRMD